MPIFRARLRYEYGVDLIGVKNGVNRIFMTPGYFVEQTIEVYHNGRRLIRTDTDLPNEGDYTVAESVPGAGYDTVVLLSFIPVPTSELRADYQIG